MRRNTICCQFADGQCEGISRRSRRSGREMGDPAPVTHAGHDVGDVVAAQSESPAEGGRGGYPLDTEIRSSGMNQFIVLREMSHLLVREV